MSDKIKQAVQYYISGCYSSALDILTNAVEENPESLDAIAFKAQTLNKLQKYEQSLLELEKAINLFPNSYDIKLRKGQAEFGLKRFFDADFTFNEAFILCPSAEDRKVLALWSNKTKVECDELRKNEESANFPVVNWSQNNNMIEIEYKNNSNVPSESITAKFEKRRFVLSQDDKELLVINLCNSIQAEGSSLKLQENNLRILLQKEVKDFNWIHFDQMKNNALNARPVYPSSYKKKKDWDRINIEAELEAFADSKENEGTMWLFKELYERGDENTRRAMIKSYQTSGGTSLSTEWSSVADKDYEGKDKLEPPEGQMWAPKN